MVRKNVLRDVNNKKAVCGLCMNFSYHMISENDGSMNEKACEGSRKGRVRKQKFSQNGKKNFTRAIQ